MARPRPNHIEDALTALHSKQWFTWTDSSNKIYANLKLTEKVGVNGNLVDNPAAGNIISIICSFLLLIVCFL